MQSANPAFQKLKSLLLPDNQPLRRKATEKRKEREIMFPLLRAQLDARTLERRQITESQAQEM